RYAAAPPGGAPPFTMGGAGAPPAERRGGGPSRHLVLAVTAAVAAILVVGGIVTVFLGRGGPPSGPSRGPTGAGPPPPEPPPARLARRAGPHVAHGRPSGRLLRGHDHDRQRRLGADGRVDTVVRLSGRRHPQRLGCRAGTDGPGRRHRQRADRSADRARRVLR